MDNFAFIIHPIDPKRDVSRKFPRLGKYLTVRQINFFSTFFPPLYISEITGMEGSTLTMQDIFVFRRTGATEAGAIEGRFLATGIRPRCHETIRQAGIELPANLFVGTGVQ